MAETVRPTCGQLGWVPVAGATTRRTPGSRRPSGTDPWRARGRTTCGTPSAPDARAAPGRRDAARRGRPRGRGGTVRAVGRPGADGSHRARHVDPGRGDDTVDRRDVEHGHYEPDDHDDDAPFPDHGTERVADRDDCTDLVHRPHLDGAAPAVTDQAHRQADGAAGQADDTATAEVRTAAGDRCTGKKCVAGRRWTVRWSHNSTADV